MSPCTGITGVASGLWGCGITVTYAPLAATPPIHALHALYERYERYSYKAFLNTAAFRTDYLRYLCYARLCFELFGDRVVKHQLVPFNEPYIISILGHLNGALAPSRRAQDGVDTKHEPWRVARPTSTPAIRRLEFLIAWFGDPIFLGTGCPASMKEYLGDRLPAFARGEHAPLRETAAFNTIYGMNHYSTKYTLALHDPPADDDWTGDIEEGAIDQHGVEIGPVSQMQWLRIAPERFRKLMKWVWDRCHLPVTENGCPCVENRVETAIDDKFRQRYLGLYST
ncbi:glycoside hydrolase family 1 protein [Cadophora sp. DSE1049]|nr:glycoside hydrolase family 1 protein [Cadophora sp. DSE1049]